MKKIINNKLYDTTTAQLVGSWDNNMGGTFDYAAESLYRKRTEKIGYVNNLTGEFIAA